MKFLFSIRCNRIKKMLLVFAVLVILSLFVCSAVKRKFSTTIAALQTVQNLTFSPGQDKRTGPTKNEHILFNGENLNEAYHDIDLMTQMTLQQKSKYAKQHLLHACAEMNRTNYTEFQDTNPLSQTDWLISKRFKLIACKNFKVGSTNIARVLYTLDNLSKHNNSNQIGTFKARLGAMVGTKIKSTAALEILLKSYTKFVFIRDPIERLLSAYRDHRPRQWFKPAYRDNRPSTRFKKSKKAFITFRSYLERLVAIPDRLQNDHMISYTRMCNPCQIKYDFIGFIDTFETDMRTILSSVGADKYIILPNRTKTGYDQTKTNTILQYWLKDLPKPLIQKIYENYYWDYFLFGFTKPDFKPHAF